MDVTPRSDSIQIDYVIEVPMTKLVLIMERYKGTKGIVTLGPKDEVQFRKEMIDFLTKGISLYIDGQANKLEWNPNYSESHGEGDAGFFEYRLHLISKLNGGDSHRVKIVNDNYPIQRAVFLNVIHDSVDAYASSQNSVAPVDWSYDESSRNVEFEYRRGIKDKLEKVIDAPSANAGSLTFEDRLISHLKNRSLTAGALIAAMTMALLLGALHALSPGHGKAIVAAYLVGTHGTVRHAMALGGIVTLTHISSVMILGLIGLFLAQYIVPEYYSPFISLASGLLIAAIGAWLFIKRFMHRHSHHHKIVVPEKPTWRQLTILGISGGIVPCPTAMAVMLTAIAIGRVTLGLALIAAFSLGLAIVLIAMGIMTVKASSALNGFSKFRGLSKILPIISAAVVTILGITIIYQGFWLEWSAMR